MHMGLDYLVPVRHLPRLASALFFFLFFFFFFFNNIYLVTTLLMTILTSTWRKNKNKVQEIKEKYDVTASFGSLGQCILVT